MTDIGVTLDVKFRWPGVGPNGEALEYLHVEGSSAADCERAKTHFYKILVTALANDPANTFDVFFAKSVESGCTYVTSIVNAMLELVSGGTKRVRIRTTDPVHFRGALHTLIAGAGPQKTLHYEGALDKLLGPSVHRINVTVKKGDITKERVAVIGSVFKLLTNIYL